MKTLLIAGLAAALALAAPAPARALDADGRRAIDAELAARGLNEFGDPPGTVYWHGSPLVNRAGDPVDRYDYILRRHPEFWRMAYPVPARAGREAFVAPPADRASPPPPPF